VSSKPAAAQYATFDDHGQLPLHLAKCAVKVIWCIQRSLTLLKEFSKFDLIDLRFSCCLMQKPQALGTAFGAHGLDLQSKAPRGMSAQRGANRISRQEVAAASSAMVAPSSVSMACTIRSSFRLGRDEAAQKFVMPDEATTSISTVGTTR